MLSHASLTNPCYSDLALSRHHNVVVRSSEGVGELAEDDGFFGDRDVLLQAMVPVVHTHTHHLLRGQDWSQQLDVRSLQHTLTRGQRSEGEGLVIYGSSTVAAIVQESS